MDKPPHFRLAGVPVRIEPFFLIVIVVLGVGAFQGVFLFSWVVIATVSVLVHEMGHALAFKAFGIQPSVVLYGLGGLTTGRGELSPGRSVVVSLAGPLSTLVLFGLPTIAYAGSVPHDRATGIVLEQLLFVNVGWAILNLLPVLPLDGGNVFASLVEMVVKGKGRLVGNVVSIGFAGLAAIWASQAPERFPLMILAGFVAVMNIAELAQRRSEPAIGPNGQLAEAQRALVARRPDLAEHLARGVLATRTDPSTAAWAAELVAWARLWAGDLATASQVASAMPGGSQPSRAFQGAYSLAAGDRVGGVAVLAWSFVHEPSTPAKLFAAMVAARAGAVGEIVNELLLLDPVHGRNAATELQQLLAYAGFPHQAAEVGAMLTGYLGPTHPPSAVPDPWHHTRP
ncbi:MAG: hypothetical protein N2037_09300 [Acidimicrobiales bacterium]|nr:hypothetical protein [Acidimicrobiales bacterium]